MRARFRHLIKSAAFKRLYINADLSHILKCATFARLTVDANFKRLFAAGIFTNRQPVARTRYRTVGGVNRTIPNGSIRHV